MNRTDLIESEEDAWECSKKTPCYDCGSTIPKQHTALCAFSNPGDVLDLPMLGNTQWWTGSVAKKTTSQRR